MDIICLVGKSYSGRSKIADLIVKHDPKFIIRSYAQVVKYYFGEEYGIPSNMLDVDSYRPNLYDYELAHTKEKPNVYSELLIDDLKPDAKVIIDDLKYIEGLKYFVGKGAYFYKVHTDNHIRKTLGWNPNIELDQHIGETDLDISGDALVQCAKGRGGIIYNSKGIDYLQEQVVYLLRKDFASLATVG